MAKNRERERVDAVTCGRSGSAILHQRAVALAARESRAAESAGMQVLRFAVGKETYAFETALVSEVCPVSDLAVLPGTPEFVLGVVSVRGTIMSVLDLRPLFGTPLAPGHIPASVIVLRSEAMEFCVAVDSVNEVGYLPRGEIRQSLSALAGRREEYVIGVTSERVVVLDAARLLSDPRLTVRHDADTATTTREG